MSKTIKKEPTDEISAVADCAEETKQKDSLKKTPEKKTPEKKIETKTSKKRLRISEVDMNELVEVQSCFYGELIYVSKDGYTCTWSDFGDSVMLSNAELLKMRNQQVAFFKNQWIIPVGDNAEDTINFLQVEHYYKNIIPIDDFDEIFSYTPEDLANAIEKLSPNLKETVARRAYALIKDGSLDSIKLIETIEKHTGFDLRD